MGVCGREIFKGAISLEKQVKKGRRGGPPGSWICSNSKQRKDGKRDSHLSEHTKLHLSPHSALLFLQRTQCARDLGRNYL